MPTPKAGRAALGEIGSEEIRYSMRRITSYLTLIDSAAIAKPHPPTPSFASMLSATLCRMFNGMITRTVEGCLMGCSIA